MCAGTPTLSARCCIPDRASVPAATAWPGPPVEAHDLSPRRVDRDAVLVTYRSTAGNRSALRSSLWVRDEAAGWLLLFHQGTPTDAQRD